ncbi:uncharacterized protein FPRN_06349 [Fusarium proliferatum]|nr:uncharacterized protein FPRN_06349 [Fusarium proliferatum]
MEWEEFHDWLLCQMEAIAGPAEENEWTLEDIYKSHGDRLRYVAMSNNDYAAFLEWREPQTEPAMSSPYAFVTNWSSFLVFSTQARAFDARYGGHPGLQEPQKLGNHQRTTSGGDGRRDDTGNMTTVFRYVVLV